MEQGDNIKSQYAMQLAFKTMTERCQQLQARLAIVEEENITLSQQYEKINSNAIIRLSRNDENNFQSQQEKIEKLKRQNSQLSHHIFMVSSENQQLWKKLTRTVKPLVLEKEHSFEEISLPLINSIMIEKSELMKQYDKIIELQKSTTINLKNIGFTYPEDVSLDSLDQLRYLDIKLTQLKEELLVQQNKIKNTLYNIKKMKINETCNICKHSIEKLTCQTGTQFDSHCNLKENGQTQTSLPTCSFAPEKKIQSSETENICPLCEIVFNKSVSFELFHEHVVNHFNKEIIDDF